MTDRHTSNKLELGFELEPALELETRKLIPLARIEFNSHFHLLLFASAFVSCALFCSWLFLLVSSRHFISQPSLDSHLTSKVHRKQLKKALEPQYTQAEAEAGAGMAAAR